MATNVSYYLVITLILSLGFGQLLRFEFWGIPLFFHDLLTLLILILNLQGLTLQGLKSNKFTLFFVGLILSWVYALTLYPLASLFVPFLYTLRLLAYLSLFSILKNQKISAPQTIFVISGSATIVIGLIQYLFLPDMRIFEYLGWDDHLSRLTLPHFDPTFTGVMIALFLLSSFNLDRAKNIFFKCIGIVALLLTYSRSVWISLISAVTMSLIIQKKYNLVLIGIALSILVIALLPKRFGEGTNLLRTYSITSRFQSDLDYIGKYKWDLFIGRGMNTLILDRGVSQYDDHATGPNNSYLYLLATTGTVGLIGWLGFMKYLFVQSHRKSMLVCFFIASLFNNVMFYPFSLLWILLIETQPHKLENLRI